MATKSTKKSAKNAKPLTRTAEYRRALASLPDESVGVALACYVFSSIHQKMRLAKAMRRFEELPGFGGWTTFSKRPPVGPALAIKSVGP